MLPVSENNHPFNRLRPEEPEKTGELLIAGNRKEMLIDQIGHHMFRFGLHRHRIDKPALHQTQNFRFQRRAEQHRLPFSRGRKFRHDPAHIRNESHIQHPVCLIDHQDLGLGKVERSASGVIQNASRSPGQNIHRFLNGFALFLVIHSAENRLAVESGIASEFAGVLFDLHCQFAGGFQHEDAAGFRFPLRLRRTQKTGHGRGQERGGLSRSGLRLGRQIASGESVRQAFCLDHRAVLEPELLGADQHFPRQIQIAETGFPFRRFDLDQIGHRRRRLRCRGSFFLFSPSGGRGVLSGSRAFFRSGVSGILFFGGSGRRGRLSGSFFTAARRTLSFAGEFFPYGGVDKTFSGFCRIESALDESNELFKHGWSIQFFMFEFSVFFQIQRYC